MRDEETGISPRPSSLIPHPSSLISLLLPGREDHLQHPGCHVPGETPPLQRGCDLTASDWHRFSAHAFGLLPTYLERQAELGCLIDAPDGVADRLRVHPLPAQLPRDPARSHRPAGRAGPNPGLGELGIIDEPALCEAVDDLIDDLFLISLPGQPPVDLRPAAG